MNSFKSILILFISSSFLSCNGQVKSENPSTKKEQLKFGKTVTELDARIWKVFQDSKGNFWFGSNGKGIYHFDGENLKLITTKDGLVDNTIRGIQEDLKGNIFIETPLGISKFDGKKFTTLKPKSDKSNDWKLEPNDLWFAYEAIDVFRYDGESLYELKLPRQDLEKAFGEKIEEFPFKARNNTPYAVYGINKDKEGNIWLGTLTAGAFRYDGKSFLWFGEKELSTLPDGRVPGVRSMLQDKNGFFWLSNFISNYKIDVNNPKGYEKVPTGIASTGILGDKIGYFNSGLVDIDGNLWMTTYGGGVWKYDGEKLTNYEVNNGKENVLLVSIFEDSDGTFWLGTDNDGVYFGNGEKFEKFVLTK